MNNIQRKTLSTVLFMTALLGLSACSAVSKVSDILTTNSTVNYENNKSVKSLEVPPDLTSPEFDRAFELPKGVVSLKTGKVIPQSGSSTTVAPKVKLSSVVKSGDRDVLKVNTNYARALVLTETMLTRMGFSTISKSPSGNEITAKYNGEDVATSENSNLGILSRFRITLGKDGRVVNRSLLKGETYVITVFSEKGAPIVRFAKANKVALTNAQHSKIVNLLNTTFNN